MKERRVTELKKKIVLLLAAGVALSNAKTRSKQVLILGELSMHWKEVTKDSLQKSLTSLYQSDVISLKPKGDAYEIVLSREGKKLAARFNLETLVIKRQEKWDGLWRIVLFDIPEPRKKARDAIRFHLKDMGLIEYQKSVFITPYPCQKELKFVAEFFNARKYIRFIVAKAIDNELEFKRKFEL